MSEVLDATEVASNEIATEGASSTESGLDVITETTTYAVTRSQPKEGSDKPGELGFSVLKEGNSTWLGVNGDATKNPPVEPKLELLQTIEVSYPVANSVKGIQSLITDEDEIVNIFNKGAMSKITTRVRSYFTEVDEAGSLVHLEETAYDATSDLAEPMKRRALSDTQKAVKVLKGISAEALAEALRSMGILS